MQCSEHYLPVLISQMNYLPFIPFSDKHVIYVDDIDVTYTGVCCVTELDVINVVKSS